MAFCYRCGVRAPIKTSIECDKIEGNWLEKWIDKDEESKLAELPDDIWVEIMGKLPIKALYMCKCVSKAWHSQACYIVDTYKGIQLPPHGLLFEIFSYQPGSTTKNCYLGYLSFGDRRIKRLFRDDKLIDHQDTDRNKIKVDEDHYGYGSNGISLSLGNLTLDLGSLVSDTREKIFWSMHRGLVLTISSTTYHVYNPATGQIFVLPTAPSIIEQLRNSKRVAFRHAAIINLSDCLLSTQSNFRVVKFAREPHRILIEFYCSNKHQWFQSEAHLDRAVYTTRWCLGGTVYLDNTLFFMTGKRHLVAVKFVSSEQVTVYSLRLPQLISKGYAESTLHGSQGCLYLFYNSLSDLWIWKHNASSIYADAWIPQLIFLESGMSLCQPVTEKYLRQFMADDIIAVPMIIHPEAPLVFFFAPPSIFAIHLLNDTVEKIAELAEGESFSTHYLYMYSPCFSSFKCPQPVNQTC